MKYRESGMPTEQTWNTFFNPVEIITKMNIDNKVNTLVDVGCGYGTFLLPMAEVIGKKVIGLDIDHLMLDICADKISQNNISNIDLIKGDISTDETLQKLKTYTDGIDYVTLFNILHCEEPMDLLNSIYYILNNNGRIGVIHWKHEETPRGPSMEIRPKPEMIVGWANKIGFQLEKQIDLPPYHYGLIFIKY